MIYYFVADEFDRYDMSLGYALAISTEFEPLRKAYPTYPIWKFEGGTLFDFDSLGTEDSRVTPYDGSFDAYHCFELDKEFEKVSFDWNKLDKEGLCLEIDWEETYVQGEMISEPYNLEAYREKLRKCIQIPQEGEIAFKSLVEALKAGGLSTEEFIEKSKAFAWYLNQ